MLLYAIEGKHSFRPGNLSSSLEAHFEEPDFDFVLLLFVVELCVECVEAVLVCVFADEVECDVPFFCEAFERARTLGASFTGSATVRVVPGRTVFPDM